MDITEKDYYLKYFFLIDSNLLLANIERELHIESSQHPFHIIFNEINKACHRYTKSIFFPMTNFDHSQKSSGIEDTYKDLYERALQYHCILHGLMSNIQAYDINQNNQIKISGAENTRLLHGYFETEYFTTAPSSLPNGDEPSDNISKNYNEHKKRFHRQEDGYAYSILKKFSRETDTNFPTVAAHDGNWACFIYSDYAPATFNKSIKLRKHKQTRTFLNNYKKLLEACCIWCETNRLSACDQFLFEHAMESIYGFSFFNYAAKLLEKIHTASSNDEHIDYKDLEGTVIQNLIQQTARLPITYNRSVFLEYAIQLVVASESLKSQEYREHAHRLFTNISLKQYPNDFLIISGLDDIKRYLQKLIYIAIPLFENLWDVLIDKLNHRKNIPLIKTETYCTYIEENYLEMTKNISCIFNQHPDPRLKPLDNITALCQDYRENISLSKYVRESFENLLLKYFDIRRFDGFPPSPVDALLPYVIKEDRNIKPSENTNELNYIQGHIATIMSYSEYFNI